MQTSTRTAPALSSKVACGSTSGAGARAGALVGARAHAAAALAVLESATVHFPVCSKGQRCSDN